MHIPFARSDDLSAMAGRRAWLALSQRVLEAAEGAVADALVELGRRPEDARRAARTTDRMREVVSRDRDAVLSLARAERSEPTEGGAEQQAPTEPTVASEVPAAAKEEAHRSACDEPIRTRTYAKLLAAQGEPQRALSIYLHLLEERASDATLAAEAAELRRLLELESAIGT